MALFKTHSALDSLVEEVTMATVDTLAEMLKDKVNLQIFQELKATLKSDIMAANTKKKASKKLSNSEDIKEKKKRAPSAYNLFIKGKMAEIKATNPEVKGKDLMKAAVHEWNKQKPVS